MAAPTSSLGTYVVRRLLLMIPTLIGITLVTFVLCQFVPGGPIDQYRMRLATGAGGGESGAAAGGSVRGGPGGGGFNIPEDQLRILREYYGFDRPIPLRYVRWLGNIAQFDLGTSYRFSRPVHSLILERLPISIFYGIVTTILTYGICIPLGILKAIKHRTVIDDLTAALIFCGYAVPAFALGAVLLTLFSVKYPIFPLMGFVSENFKELSLGRKILDLLWHAVLPLICYMVGQFAVMTMLMKNSLLEQMGSEYVRTALAKGVPARRVLVRHALRNSLIPLASTFGHNISLFITGAVLIERVFSIHGVGLLVFEATVARDYPIVMGMIFIASLLFLVGNLLSDLCVAAVDPRVRFS